MDKSDKALRALFRRRINSVAKAFMSDQPGKAGTLSVEFENWFVAMMRSERRTWYQQGVEDAKKHPNAGEEI